MFAVPDNTLLRPENPALRHPVRVALEVAADRDRWRHLLRYDPDERFATLVSEDERQEVWLMSWLPGQATGLHDHGATSGAFTIVSGELTEFVAHRGRTHQVGVGLSRVFGPGYVHDVRNAGPDPAVSIHVYRAARTMRHYPRLSRVS